MRNPQRLHHHIANMREQLRNAGVTTISAVYDGYADSGAIEHVAVQPDVELPESLCHTLEDLFYDLLEARVPGWQDNEGAWGTFVWDLTTDTATHEHHQRVTNFVTSRWSGWDAP